MKDFLESISIVTATIVVFILFLAPVAHAEHPELEEGKIYRIAPQYLCKSSDVVSKIIETQFEKGLQAARAYVQIMARMGQCSMIKGGGAKFLGTVDEWRKDNEIFLMHKWGDAKGGVWYGLRGYQAHDKQT